jgi:hypothetical protein
MRLLSTLDWRDFFESVSLVDPLLGEDPAGVYARMNFQTRDRYRHVVERIAKRTGTDELEVARGALRLAAEARTQQPRHAVRAHVGNYLVGDEVVRLEQVFRYRPKLRERAVRLVLRHPSFFYLGALALITALIVAGLCFTAYQGGASGAVLVGLALLSLVPASDLVLSVLNWDVTHLFQPRLLPSMETRRGVPEDARAMVVISTLFTGEAAVKELLQKLEVHYLANQDENLYFALLGEFRGRGR